MGSVEKNSNRLEPHHLINTNVFKNDESRITPFRWEVYGAYQGILASDGNFYFQAQGRFRGYKPEIVRSYDPLVDEPDLFLKFAHLQEQHNWRAALSPWIHTYGLLGLSQAEPRRIYKAEPEVSLPPYRYNPEGGPGETAEAVRKETRAAYYALNLYEAVLANNVKRIEHFLFPEGEPFEYVEETKRAIRKLQSGKNLTWDEAVVDKAWLIVLDIVQSMVSLFVFPAVNPMINLSSEPISPDALTYSWEPRNLLGAMYLQFYWLITSGARLCKWCNHVIPQTRSDRKTRSDKEFCSKRCFHNHHYHTRRKRERQSQHPST